MIDLGRIVRVQACCLMVKLHKRPPAEMNSVSQAYSPSTSQPHSSYSQNGWNIWYPTSSSSSTGQKDACPSSSLVSRTMSYAKGHFGSSSPNTSVYGHADKSRYTSGATQLARRSANVAVAISNSNSYTSSTPHPIYQSQLSHGSGISYEFASAPRTEGERYWAYRAIVAEVKLAERMGVRADELERMKEELRRQVGFLLECPVIIRLI